MPIVFIIPASGVDVFIEGTRSFPGEDSAKDINSSSFLPGLAIAATVAPKLSSGRAGPSADVAPSSTKVRLDNLRFMLDAPPLTTEDIDATVEGSAAP